MCRPLDLVYVKGKTIATKIYEVIGEIDNVTEAQCASIDVYKNIMNLYFKREFSMAKRHVLDYLRTNPTDKAASLLLGQCDKFKQTPPDKNWNI